MLVRGKLIRKYWKVITYLLLISLVAFTFLKMNAKNKAIVLVKEGFKKPLESRMSGDKSTSQGEKITSEKQNIVVKDLKLPNVHHSVHTATGQEKSPKRSEEEILKRENYFQKSDLKPDSAYENNTMSSTSRKPEVRHIGFLKVHKAASSTMQNIFFRFGLKRNLTFVFTQHPNYFSKSVKTFFPLTPPKLRLDGQRYDILCNHGIFNYSIYSSILPNDTVYIGIVRDPLSVFISAVNYYSQKSQAIPYLARIRVKKLQKLIHHPQIFDKGFFSYTKNVMARDFGFPASNDVNEISAKLKELDNIFRFVLIVKRFEESLVLMKRYLNWRMQDILFIPNNVYREQSTAVSARELTQSDIEMFKTRNRLDYVVYEFFLNRFQKQFKSEPDDINVEVLQFRKVLGYVSTFCNGKKESNDVGILVIEASDWNDEFSVSAEDCWAMKFDELDFIKLLRRRQGSEIKPPPVAKYPRRDRLGLGHWVKIGYHPDKRFPGKGLNENNERREAKMRFPR